MTDKQKRRTFLKVAGSTGAIGITGLAGCSGGGGSSGGTSGGDTETSGGTTGASGGGTQTITLGGSMSLSGDNANLGQLYKDAYQLTIDRINQNGGFKAGDGNTYELEMILRDDGTDPSKAKSIYQELIAQENVKYLLGPYASSVTLPASAVAAANKRPMVEGGGASPEIFQQGNEWIFGLLPTADKYPKSTIEMSTKQDPKPSRAALLVQDDTFSKFAAKGAREKIQNTEGLEVVVDRTFPSSTSDLSTALGQVRSANADILLLCAHQRHATIAAGQMETQNVNVDLAMATVGTLTDSFKKQTGKNGNYWYGPSSWASSANFQDPVYGNTQNYVKAIKNKYDYTPDYHSAAGATVIETFLQAFKQVDELGPTPVRNAIRDIQYTSLYGDISFAKNGVINKNMLVYQWQPDAGKTIVWPKSVQQQAPIYPMPNWSER
ncbi:MAG: amino acid ABC transporter substrate-binding protein [Halobellus sp.]